MDLQDHLLNVLEVRTERVEVAASLQMLGRGANGNPFFLDDVSYPESFGRDGPEAKEAEGGIATVGSREDAGAKQGPTGVTEDGWEFDAGFGCARARIGDGR